MLDGGIQIGFRSDMADQRNHVLDVLYVLQGEAGLGAGFGAAGL